MKRTLKSHINVKNLKANEIFVFGSNLNGRHGKGAALDAVKAGALYGQGEGLQGQTYAIPTKGFAMETLSLKEIKKYVDNFIQFATQAKELTFLVTEIGCGLAGYNKHQIAPLFFECLRMDNVKLSQDFYLICNSLKNER